MCKDSKFSLSPETESAGSLRVQVRLAPSLLPLLGAALLHHRLLLVRLLWAPTTGGVRPGKLLQCNGRAQSAVYANLAVRTDPLPAPPPPPSSAGSGADPGDFRTTALPPTPPSASSAMKIREPRAVPWLVWSPVSLAYMGGPRPP